MIMQTGIAGNVSVGARVIPEEIAYTTINIDQLDINIGQDVFLAGSNNQIAQDESILGVYGSALASPLEHNPLTATQSNFDLQIGGSMRLNTRHSGTITTTLVAVANGTLSKGNGHYFNVTIQNDLEMAASKNYACLLSTDQLNLTTQTGGIYVEGLGSGIGAIGAYNASGPSTLTAGTNIYLEGKGESNSAVIKIFNSGADYPLNVIANQDIQMEGYAKILHQGTGAITCVVDNQYPTSPEIGSGIFRLAETSQIGQEGGGPVRIFTAKRSQNMVESNQNINGQTFIPGTLFTNSQTEQWGVYYPDLFIGNENFTFFYKNNS